MTTGTKLAVCIPTHNREHELDDLLKSIPRDRLDLFEIVISDNASTDETEAMVARHRLSLPNIRYSRATENRGFDWNINEVVFQSSAEYCWLVGSDDWLRPESLEVVLDQISGGYGVYLFDRLEATVSPARANRVRWVHGVVGPTTYMWHDQASMHAYFEDTTSFGALFSCIGSLVFRRECWIDCSNPPKGLGTGYSHVFTYVSMLDSVGQLRYVDRAILVCRLPIGILSYESRINGALRDLATYSKICERYRQVNPAVAAGVARLMFHYLSRTYLVNLAMSASRLGPEGSKDELIHYVSKYGGERKTRFYRRVSEFFRDKPKTIDLIYQFRKVTKHWLATGLNFKAASAHIP